MSKLQKIKRGQYIYKGFRVNNCGYHQPDQSIVWEAIDEDDWVLHGFSRKEVLRRIDEYLERKLNVK